MTGKAKILLMTPNLKGAATGINRIQPALGPSTMAAVLKQQGYDVRVHDCALEGWNNRKDLGDNTIVYGQSDDEIAGTISDFSPDVLGISILFSNLSNSAHDVARIAKKVNPKIKIVFGGNHLSNSVVDYEYALRTPNSNMPLRIFDMEDENIDFGMRGECDYEFPRLVDVLSRTNWDGLSWISGLVARGERTNGHLEFLINPAPRAPDITDLPAPLFDREMMEKYFAIGAFHHPFMRVKKEGSSEARVYPIMCSRGCPERCNFCTTPKMFGNKVRWRSIEGILQELERAKDEFRVEEIQIEDDNLTANKKYLYELCKGLKKIGLPWGTPNGTKANYHTQTSEMYKVMADSGCYLITIAAESGVQRVLDEIANKRLKLEETARAFENAREAGLFIHSFWILGFPGERYEEMLQTIEFASAQRADSYSFAIYNPLPGTPHYHQVMRDNLWWPGRSFEQMKFRSSLIKIDGFDSPEQFEQFVGMANKTCNNIPRTREPERYRKYVGDSFADAYRTKVT